MLFFALAGFEFELVEAVPGGSTEALRESLLKLLDDEPAYGASGGLVSYQPHPPLQPAVKPVRNGADALDEEDTSSGGQDHHQRPDNVCAQGRLAPGEEAVNECEEVHNHDGSRKIRD